MRPSSWIGTSPPDSGHSAPEAIRDRSLKWSLALFPVNGLLTKLRTCPRHIRLVLTPDKISQDRLSL